MWNWVSNKTSSIKKVAKSYAGYDTPVEEEVDDDIVIIPTMPPPRFKRINEEDLLNWDMNAHIGYLTIDFSDSTNSTNSTNSTDSTDSAEVYVTFTIPLISDKRAWVLHKSIYENDLVKLREYISWGCFDINNKVKHGNTPLHLAIFRNSITMVRLLLACGANIGTKNNLQWKCFTEAVSMGNREIIAALHYAFKLRGSKAFEERTPLVLQHLQSIGISDFELSIDWKFSSWVPFVSSLLPNDTYRIYKKDFADGSVRLRLDTTLVDFNQLRWKRGNISFLWVSNGSEPHECNRKPDAIETTDQLQVEAMVAVKSAQSTQPTQPTQSHSIIDREHGASLYVLDHEAKTYRMMARLERDEKGGFHFVRSGRSRIGRPQISTFSTPTMKNRTFQKNLLKNLLDGTLKPRVVYNDDGVINIDKTFDSVGFSVTPTAIENLSPTSASTSTSTSTSASTFGSTSRKTPKSEIARLVSDYGFLYGISEWLKREELRDSIDKLQRETFSQYSKPTKLEFIRSKTGFWNKSDLVEDDVWKSNVYDLPAVDILSKKRSEFIPTDKPSTKLSLSSIASKFPSSSSIKNDILQRKILKHTRYFTISNIKRRIAYRRKYCLPGNWKQYPATLPQLYKNAMEIYTVVANHRLENGDVISDESNKFTENDPVYTTLPDTLQQIITYQNAMIQYKAQRAQKKAQKKAVGSSGSGSGHRAHESTTTNKNTSTSSKSSHLTYQYTDDDEDSDDVSDDEFLDIDDDNYDLIPSSTSTSTSTSASTASPRKPLSKPSFFADDSPEAIMYTLDSTALQKRIAEEIQAGNDDDAHIPEEDHEEELEGKNKKRKEKNDGEEGDDDGEEGSDSEGEEEEEERRGFDEFDNMSQDKNGNDASATSVATTVTTSADDETIENNNMRLLNVIKVYANRFDAFQLNQPYTDILNNITSDTTDIAVISPIASSKTTSSTPNINIASSITPEEMEYLTNISLQHLQSLPPPKESLALVGTEGHRETNQASTPTSSSPSNDIPCSPHSFESYLRIPVKSKRSHLGRALKVVEKLYKLKARVSMSDEFPIPISSVISILDAVMPADKAPQLQKFKEFVSTRLPPGFPVKVQMPVFPTIMAQISFGKFYMKPLAQDIFEIPSSYRMDLATQSQLG